MKIAPIAALTKMGWRQKLRFSIKPAFLGLFAIAISLAVFINACSMGFNQSLQPLRVGLVSWPGFDIARYGQVSEIFRQRGLEVELVRFENSQDVCRAAMRGSLDAAFSSFWDVMQVDSGDAKPVVLLTADISAGSDGIVARSGIQSIKDLVGKQIGAKLGTVNHLILLEALKTQQIQPDEIEIRDYSHEVAIEKITAGEIDAAVLWEPMLSDTATKIQGNVIYTTQQVDSLVIDVLMSSDRALKAKKAELKQFLLAWFDLMQAVETKPAQVFETVGKELGQSGEAFAIDYSGLKKGDIALNQRMFQVDGRLSSARNEIIKLLEADRRHGRTIRQDVEIDGALVNEAMKGWKP